MASFDTILSLVDYLAEKGAIEKDGARYLWDGAKLYKKQLADKVREAGEYQRLVDLAKTL
jgi:hypothetical protein